VDDVKKLNPTIFKKKKTNVYLYLYH